MPPTARDAGFAGAVEALAAARARGEQPAALVVTTLSPRRLRELHFPNENGPRDVLLSGQTAKGHYERFRDFTDADWRRIENLLTGGPDWIEDRPRFRVLWTEEEKPWKGVIKQAQRGNRELFLITAHRVKQREIKELRAAKERERA